MKKWSHPPGLNRRPADYESAALPAELGWPENRFVACIREQKQFHLF